jgi:sensor domain CHASE-containing protein
MLMRYVDNNFTANFYNTIGVDFVLFLSSKTLENQNYRTRKKERQIANSTLAFLTISGTLQAKIVFGQ